MRTSRVLPRAASAVAALFLTAALFQAAPARADIVFDFSGTCTQDCTGIVTAVLTLADTYTFGDDIMAADFISFDYSSSQFSFDLTSADNPVLRGGLNADGSLSDDEFLSIIAAAGFPGFNDLQTIQGNQELVAATMGFPNDVSIGAFTLVGGAVPEPSTWAMLLLGFAGLGFAGWGKRDRQPQARPAPSFLRQKSALSR